MARPRKKARILEGGSFGATALGTFLALAGIPVGGVGAVFALFGTRLSGVAVAGLGAGMHLVGRRLLSR